MAEVEKKMIIKMKTLKRIHKDYLSYAKEEKDHSDKVCKLNIL